MWEGLRNLKYILYGRIEVRMGCRKVTAFLPLLLQLRHYMILYCKQREIVKLSGRRGEYVQQLMWLYWQRAGRTCTTTDVALLAEGWTHLYNN